MRRPARYISIMIRSNDRTAWMAHPTAAVPVLRSIVWSYHDIMPVCACARQPSWKGTCWLSSPTAPLNLLWEELWKIMKLMSQTINSTTDTPILGKRGSFEVPDPPKSYLSSKTKKASLPCPPLLPLLAFKLLVVKNVHWLNYIVNCIIAHNYGEPKCHFFQVKF